MNKADYNKKITIIIPLESIGKVNWLVNHVIMQII